MNKRIWNNLTEEQRSEWLRTQAYSRGRVHTFDGEPARSTKPPSRRDKHRMEVALRRNR